MPATKQLPHRSEVKTGDTWDLSKLFNSDAAWRRAFKKLQSQVDAYKQFRGTLKKSAKNIRACLDFDTDFELQAEKLGNYAFLKSSEDVANSTYQGMVQEYTRLATRAGEAGSYIAPEIQAIPKQKLLDYMKSPVLKPYRVQLERLMRFKPHILSEKEERLLAMQGEVAGSASRVFGQLTDADFKFGTVKGDDGKPIELTQGTFRMLLESKKRPVRKAAFEKFYTVHEDHQNTLAATLNASVLQDVFKARARNYPSALEAALFVDNVPVSVYDSLIEAVRANLDTLYRYLEIRRKALKVRDLHVYDTYAPIVDTGKTKVPYAKAVDMVADAVSPLGSEYSKTLRTGLNGRWVDRYENKGKRSGAFSSGGYDCPPYILMNYKDSVLDGVFTLAHEAGHSMHTWYSARSQPFQNYQYTIFVAEVASTFNEQLLNRYMLDRARDTRRRARLISREIDEIRGTIIRQTMFAEFEKILHAAVEAGEPLTLERIRAEYRKLLDAYFGPDTAIDDALELEGMRIPHFYRAFYVYKYATGLSAAIALSQRVLNGGNREREQYLNFLKSGGSKYPLDQLKDAGVDLTKPEPVNAAMAHFRELVDELEQLLR